MLRRYSVRPFFENSVRYFIRLLEFFIAFEQPSLESYGKVQIVASAATFTF